MEVPLHHSISGGEAKVALLHSWSSPENTMQILHQPVCRGEFESLIRTDLDAKLLFDCAEQLNMVQRIPFGSGTHVHAGVELGYLQNLGGDGRDFGVQLFECHL